MKNTKKLIDTCIIALFVAICACCALRCVALFTSFNAKTMHFDGSATFMISAVLATLAICLFFAPLVFIPKKYALAPNCFSVWAFIPSGILSISLLFMSYTMFMRYKSTAIYAEEIIEKIIQYIPSALAILALLAAAFFFLNIMIAKRTGSAKAYLGMCTVVFLALYGAYLYFSKEIHPTNSPNKIIDQMAFFSSALFFLYETRIALGRDMWKPYISFGLMASLLTAYSAIPALIYYFVDGESISNSVTENVLTLTLFIYITARLLMTRKLPSDDQCKMASIIEAMATRRENELQERRNAAHAHEYNYNVENEITDEDAAAEENAEAEGQIAFELDTPAEDNRENEQ